MPISSSGISNKALTAYCQRLQWGRWGRIVRLKFIGGLETNIINTCLKELNRSGALDLMNRDRENIDTFPFEDYSPTLSRIKGIDPQAAARIKNFILDLAKDRLI